jgi:hypothetical protein
MSQKLARVVSLIALAVAGQGCSSPPHRFVSSCAPVLSLQSGGHRVGLQSCAGMVGMSPNEVTLEARTGSTVVMSGVGYGYAAPASSNHSVLALTDWRPGTTTTGGRATFKALEPGSSTITLRTWAGGCLVARMEAHCPVAYVRVISH